MIHLLITWGLKSIPVYNIHLLGQVPAQFQRLVKRDILPKYTVGVNDIPQLEKKNQSYVACKVLLFFF